MKKEFVGAWFAKCYVEVNKELHVTIWINAPLLSYIYRTPICNSTLAIYKTCMQQLRKE
jgi:hypothetical protein